MKTLWLLPLVVLAMLGALGCYKPNIEPGGLSCAEGNLCPDNFHCALSNHRCYPGDAGPDVSAPPACTSATPDAATCSEPLDGGVCNPSCQFGCTCGWCAVDNGTVTCLTDTTPGSKNVGDLCDPARNADCAPGLYCYGECGTGRCYKYCGKNEDCAALGTTCGVNAKNGGKRFTLCRIPPRACDPVSGSGCPGPFACYPVGQSTECDCAGTGTAGATCSSVEGCAAGYTCITLGTNRQTSCQKTCKTGADCPLLSCANPANLMYGYCGTL